MATAYTPVAIRTINQTVNQSSVIRSLVDLSELDLFEAFEEAADRVEAKRRKKIADRKRAKIAVSRDD